jgi:hypothetical protein
MIQSIRAIFGQFETHGVAWKTSNAIAKLTPTAPQIIVKTRVPYTGITDFTGWETRSVGAPFTQEWRWSLDGKSWSDWFGVWADFKAGIPFFTASEIWAQIRLTRSTGPDTRPLWIFHSVARWDGPVTAICPDPDSSYCTEKWIAPVIPTDRWNPYSTQNINTSFQLGQKLSYIANAMYGVDVQYFKVDASIDHEDRLFKEYLQFESNEMPQVCMKVLIPNSNLGPGKLTFGPMGVDFDGELEMHIDKNYYEQYFGEGQMPQRRDVIKIPMMNRVYEVKSMTPHRTLLHQIQYYKIALQKWAPKPTSVKLNPIVMDSLLGYTRDQQDQFKSDIHTESINVTNPQINTRTDRSDEIIRKPLETDATIELSPLSINWTQVFQYYWNHSKPFRAANRAHRDLVGYKTAPEFGPDSNMTFTCWVQFTDTGLKWTDASIISPATGGLYNINFTVPITGARFAVDQWVRVESRTDPGNSFYAKIAEVHSNRIVVGIPPKQAARAARTAGWMTHGWKVATDASRVMMNAFNTNRGWFFDAYGTDYFRLQLNQTLFEWDLTETPGAANPQLQLGVWYGIVLKVSNAMQTVSLTVWRIPTASKTTRLLKSYQRTLTMPVKLQWESGDTEGPRLMSGECLQANIRILTVLLDEVEQAKFLTQELVDDASQCIVVDNAIPPNNRPLLSTK